MITELLQQPGSFDITLREGTPLAVRKSVAYKTSAGIPFGHIAVTASRLPEQSLTAAGVLAVARYAGRIQARSNHMRSYSGNGLAVWLGDAEDKCDIVTAAGGGAPATMTSVVTTYVLPTLGNGITIGDTSADTGTTRSTAFNNVPPIDLLNEFGDATGNGWRINPDGTLDIGAPATLFNDPPLVMILRGDGGRDELYYGLNASTLDVSEDFDDYATYCYVTGESGATGSDTVATSPKDFGGTNDAVIEVGINASADTTGACNTTATAYLNLHKTTRRQVDCTVEEDDIRRWLEPGDQVYLYDPECELEDTANTVTFRGRQFPPTTAMCRGITWPVTAGMGVYSIQTQDGSSTVVDLSDWFEPETGSVRLELGAPKRPAAISTPRAFGSRTA